MMISRRRSAISLAVIAGAALMFSGCGSNGGGTTAETPATQPPAETPAGEASPTPAEPGANPVQISYLHRLPDGEGMVPVADMVAKWNAEHPDIQVSSTKFSGPSPEMILKLETDINAGAGPCLAQLGYSEVPDMYVKGLVQDISQYADAYKGDFSEGAWTQMNVGGKQFGIPQDVGPLVYYYNATEFSALGIEPPKDLAEFEAEARTAHAAGKYISAFTPDEAQNWLSGQAAAAGDTWVKPEGDKWVVNMAGAGTKRVADFWQTMLDDGTTLVANRWGDGFTNALTSGELIGHIGAAWEAGFLLDPLDGTPYEGQWRVAQLPDFGAGAMTGPDGGSGVAVMTGCAYPEQATQFAAWLNTQVDDLATQGLVVAANGSPATPAKMDKQFGGQDVLAELSTATSRLSPTFGYAPGWATLTAMSQTADLVGQGQAPVMDIFSGAQTTMIDALKNLGLPVAE